MIAGMEYPNNIAVIRRIRGLSQAYVAEQIGVSRPKYIEIERGLKDITVSQLERLKETLGVDKDDLLGVDTGRFDFRKIAEMPFPPEIFIDLGIRTIWDEKNQEWLVPAAEVAELCEKLASVDIG